MEKTIYNLQLHERLSGGDLNIYRVPGGWVYVFIDEISTPVFVPYNEEFMKTFEYNPQTTIGTIS